MFATLSDDLYVAYHCVYSDDETLSPEGAWALISENAFILDHIFGVPEAVATQAVLGVAIAVGAGFDEWDTSEVVENPAGAVEYWMSKLDRARTERENRRRAGGPAVGTLHPDLGTGPGGSVHAHLRPGDRNQPSGHPAADLRRLPAPPPRARRDRRHRKRRRPLLNGTRAMWGYDPDGCGCVGGQNIDYGSPPQMAIEDAVLGSTARVGTAWTIPEAQRPNRR